MDENGAKTEKKSEDLELRLLGCRSVMLFDSISKKSANEVVKRLLVLDSENHDQIKLFINSPGGDVDAGFQIFDMIRYIKSPVRIICSGLVASAATLVLLAVGRDDRITLPNSRFLIHQPSSGIEGTVSDVEIYAREIEKLRKSLNQLISRETGQPLERVEKDTNRDCWMDAQEAIDYNLVSRIINSADQA